MELTREKALELSVKKWQMIVDNNGKPSSIIRAQFKQFKHNCPLCELYEKEISCDGCPININRTSIDCESFGHPFNKWLWDEDNTKENAQKVLDLIKSKL